MKCSWEKLSHYRDNELSPKERRRLEEHLQVCGECRSILGEYERIAQRIRATPRYAAPPGLIGNVRAAIDADAGRQNWFGSFFQTAAVAAGTLLAVLALSALYSNFHGTGDATTGATRTSEQAKDAQSGQAAVITFDQPMDHSSVEKATSVEPRIEVEYKWHGNKVVIKPKSTVEPEKSYKVVVGPEAKDAQGTPIKEPIAVTLAPPPSASTSQVAAQPATQAVTASSVAASKAEDTPTPRPTASTEPSRAVAAVPAPIPSATHTTAQPAAPVDDGQMHVTSDARITITTPSPASPAITVEPVVTFTASVTVASGCPITSTHDFGKVYAENPTLREQLGCPVEAERSVAAAEQPFQRGYTLWLSDTQQVYVLFNNGNWTSYKDTWREGDPIDGKLAPPSDLLEPTKGVGKVWRDNAPVKDGLGWATAPEHAFTGAAESFDKGLIFWSDRKVIYVLYASGNWQKVEDTPK